MKRADVAVGASRVLLAVALGASVSIACGGGQAKPPLQPDGPEMDLDAAALADETDAAAPSPSESGL